VLLLCDSDANKMGCAASKSADEEITCQADLDALLTPESPPLVAMIYHTGCTRCEGYRKNDYEHWKASADNAGIAFKRLEFDENGPWARNMATVERLWDADGNIAFPSFVCFVPRTDAAAVTIEFTAVDDMQPQLTRMAAAKDEPVAARRAPVVAIGERADVDLRIGEGQAPMLLFVTKNDCGRNKFNMFFNGKTTKAVVFAEADMDGCGKQIVKDFDGVVDGKFKSPTYLCFGGASGTKAFTTGQEHDIERALAEMASATANPLN
jgi:hypothetical protein